MRSTLTLRISKKTIRLSSDDVISMLRVAGKQIIRRPSLFADVVRKFKLNAFYLPDEKRILPR